MRRLTPLLLALTLAACATRPTTSPLSSPPAPTAPERLPAVELAAPSRPEPLPPAGVSAEAMLGWLLATYGEGVAQPWWRWFTVEHPEWGREGWRRLDQARTPR